MSETPTKQSVLEVADSTTGYDEQAVIQQFGRPLGELQLTDGATWARALVFVLRRREEGVTDEQAKDAAMKLTIKDVWGVFSNDDEESGKDEPASKQQPESSPPSVS